MKLINAISGKVLPLGRRGENLATGIIFNYDAWYREYGEGALSLVVRRPGESFIYLVELVDDKDKHQSTWEVTNVDTSYAGSGRCELQYRVNDILVKSRIYSTLIETSLDGEPSPVSPSIILIDEISKLVDEAKQYSEDADAAAEDAQKSAEAAEEATSAVLNMTVSAITLPASSDATVSKTLEEDHYNLEFGIPSALLPSGSQNQYIGYDNSNNPVAITPDSEPIQNSSNLITSNAVYQALSSISKRMNYKGAVDYYSDLPVNLQEIGDVYTVLYKGDSGEIPDGSEYIWAEVDKTPQWIELGPYGISEVFISESSDGSVEQSLISDVIYHFTSNDITNLSISLLSTTKVPQYHFDFITNSSSAPTLVLPNTVILDLEYILEDDNKIYTLENNKYYEIDILRNRAILFESDDTTSIE